jgi:hypothetical protein
MPTNYYRGGGSAGLLAVNSAGQCGACGDDMPEICDMHCGYGDCDNEQSAGNLVDTEKRDNKDN